MVVKSLIIEVFHGQIMIRSFNYEWDVPEHLYQQIKRAFHDNEELLKYIDHSYWIIRAKLQSNGIQLIFPYNEKEFKHVFCAQQLIEGAETINPFTFFRYNPQDFICTQSKLKPCYLPEYLPIKIEKAKKLCPTLSEHLTNEKVYLNVTTGVISVYDSRDYCKHVIYRNKKI